MCFSLAGKLFQAGCPSQAEGVKSRTLRKRAPSSFTCSVWMSNVLANILGAALSRCGSWGEQRVAGNILGMRGGYRP